MILYGWIEQNEASFGIEAVEIDSASESDLTIDDDGSVFGPCSIVPEGEWFVTFATAKRAAIKHWQSSISFGRYALRVVRAQRKSDLTKQNGKD